MEKKDVTNRFREMLADLYPGEGVEAPQAIVIGGEAPDLTIDFGLVKEPGLWRVPERFEDLVEPLLLREAYRAGFPAKTVKAPSMVHACNWFAWKSIADKGLRKRFMDTWIEASKTETKSAYPYTLPPVWIQEIDKAMDVDPGELHGLLVRYAAENERLLGKQLRYDAAELWAFNKAIEQLAVPEPTIIELLYAHTDSFLKRGELPGRNWLIERVSSSPQFGPAPSTRKLGELFPLFSNIAFLTFQSNISLVNKRYLYLIFSPAPKYTNIDWEAIFHFPGLLLSVYKIQGPLCEVENETGTSYEVRFIVPATALDPLLDFLAKLASYGFFSSHHVYIYADGLMTVNFNSYIPDPSSPAFTINPIRQETNLFLSKKIDFSTAPNGAARFLSCIVNEGRRGMSAFIDKVCSAFSVSMARHDSWLPSLAKLAGISPVVAKRWLDLILHQHEFIVPEPRCSYLFNPHVPAFSRLLFLTPANISSTDRSRLAAVFPSSFSSLMRGIKTPDQMLWRAHIPRNQLYPTMRLLHELSPESRPAIIVNNPLVKIGMSVLGWFDGNGFDSVTAAIDRFTSAVPRLASGEYNVSKYQNATSKPMEELYRSL